MIAVYDPENYSNILDAIESGALYHTTSRINDDYTAIADAVEIVYATTKCLGRQVKVYFTYDKKNYQPIEEKLDILASS